jgi:YHS domain-containing protein
MISALIRELLIPLLIFLFLRRLLRGVFAGFRRPATRSPSAATPPPPAQAGGVLHKDPVCGTYVSNDSGIAQTVNGELVYFCSPECRDMYRSKNRTH